MIRQTLLLAVACIAIPGTPQVKRTPSPTEGAAKLLVSSIQSRDMAGVRIAFDQGADPNQGDNRTPMHHALDSYWAAGFIDPKDPGAESKKRAERNKSFEIIKFLFNKNAKLKNDGDEFFMAIMSKDKSFFEYLLSKGLNPHGKYENYNLIQLAYVYSVDQIIPLLEKRKVPKLDSATLPGLKLMRAFYSHDNEELQNLLFNEKIDVNSFDPNGTTILFQILKLITWMYSPDQLIIVLKANPNWNIKSKLDKDFGQYPLHIIASQLKYYDPKKHVNVPGLLEMAIQNMGANPNVADDLGATPLHGAAQAGSEAGVKILLENGANPLSRDKRFNYPSALASKPEIIRMLKKAEGN